MGLLLGHCDIEVRKLDWEGQSTRDLALPPSPEIPRPLDIRGIAGDKQVVCLNLVIELGMDGKD